MAIPQYNTIQYDVNQYNASTSLLTQTLTESISESDARVSEADPVKTETVTGVDALVKLVQQAALTETITQSDAETIQNFITKIESMSETDALTNSVTSLQSDSLTPSDALTNFLAKLNEDNDVVVDAVMNFVVNGKFETVSVEETTPTPSAMYNTFMYNAGAYSQPSFSGFVKNIQPLKTEAITITENFARLVNYLRTFPETVTLTDVRAIVFSPSFVDVLLSTDVLTKQITNKGLPDTLRINDWLTVNRNPQNDPWSD